jgi:hypothetical protein
MKRFNLAGKVGIVTGGNGGIGAGTRSNSIVCPGCGRKLIIAWYGDGIDSWKRAAMQGTA